MKNGTLGHMKMRRLKRLLGCPLYQAAGVLSSIWHLAGDCADEGDVGRYSDDEIADYLEWDGDAGKLVNALVESGWLDRDPEKRLVVHDWADHCPSYIAERLKKRRLRARKQTTYVNETGDTPGTSAGQDGDTAGTVPGLSPVCPRYTQSSPVQSIQDTPAAHEEVSQPEYTYPLKSGKLWTLPPGKLAEYRDTYPRLDVDAELRKARQWCADHPRERKTASGMPRFLSGWLSRAKPEDRPLKLCAVPTDEDLAAWRPGA